MHTSKLLAGLCLGFFGVVAVSPASFAQSAPDASAPAADSSVAQPISALYARLTEMQRSHGSFAQRAQMLAPVVDQAFNLPVILQNSIGLRYRTLPETQKQQLLEQFRQFTVARYVSNFTPGGTETFKVAPAVTASPIAGDEIVHTQILSSGAATDINYVMRQGATGWQVVDILLNGNISQVAVQRADFGSGVNTGDATSLIDSLRKKTQAFSES